MKDKLSGSTHTHQMYSPVSTTDLDGVVDGGLGVAHLRDSPAELPGFLQHQVGAEHLVWVQRPGEVPQTQGYQAVNTRHVNISYNRTVL